jgi:hypothetical protein
VSLYVTADALQEYVGSTTATDYTECEVVAQSASDGVDSHCQRTFTVPTSATVRLFVPQGGDLLRVDDIANTTDLVITEDGSTVSASDYQLESSPGRVNTVNVAGQYRPYMYVRRLSGSWGCDTEATVSITARWGWTATPDAVVLATKIIGKDYFAMGDTRFGFVQVGDFSRRAAENSMAAAILAPYRRVESWGIA